VITLSYLELYELNELDKLTKWKGGKKCLFLEKRRRICLKTHFI